MLIQPSTDFNLPAVSLSNNMNFRNATPQTYIIIKPMGPDVFSSSIANINGLQATQISSTQSQNGIISPQQIRNTVVRDSQKPMISIGEINKELGSKFNAVCNPGVNYDGQKVQFLLRCIETTDPSKKEVYPKGNFRSVGVYCESTDGKTLNTLPDGKKFKIVLIPPGKEGSKFNEGAPGSEFKAGFEDFRVTEDPKQKGLLHLICTGYTGDYFNACHFTTTDLSDPEKYKFEGNIGPVGNKDLGLSPILDKNGNYVLFDRPMHDPDTTTMGSMACLTFKDWNELDKNGALWKKEMESNRISERVMIPSSGKGDSWLKKTGLGGLPIPVEVDGKKYLVHLFHSSGKETPQSDKKYRMGIALSSPDDPTKISNLAPHWIAEPQHIYETKGNEEYPAPVPNVMFPGGGYLAKNEQGADIIRGYYGAGDGSVGMFELPVKDVVNFALQYDKTGKPVTPGAEPGITVEAAPPTVATKKSPIADALSKISEALKTIQDYLSTEKK